MARREWSALVAFTPQRPRWPLPGLAGFLQIVAATFHGDRLLAELAVNPS